ncbi:hypothetical protein DDJ51_00115 [Mycobacteroides abscessus]|nr:hypothetical protein DDJ51_00115 [Mycobacteroides abscessus]PVB30179.1 hypothetical protein DDJ92_12205 [Mycobacteroides abscessus]
MIISPFVEYFVTPLVNDEVPMPGPVARINNNDVCGVLVSSPVMAIRDFHFESFMVELKVPLSALPFSMAICFAERPVGSSLAQAILT